MSPFLVGKNKKEQTPEELAKTIFSEEKEAIMEFFSPSQIDIKTVVLSQKITEKSFKEHTSEDNPLNTSPVIPEYLSDIELVQREDPESSNKEESNPLDFKM